MQYENIIKKLENRKRGTNIAINYKTQPTLSASAKREHIQVEKIVETFGRFGVNYSNIKAVKEQRQKDIENGVERQVKTMWWTWKDSNIIKQHNTNNNLYLTLTLNKIAKPKIKYMVNGKEISKQELINSGYVIASYFNSEKELPQQIDIKLENIIDIKDKKKRV